MPLSKSQADGYASNIHYDPLLRAINSKNSVPDKVKDKLSNKNILVGDTKLDKALMLRHEAYEAQSMDKQLKELLRAKKNNNLQQFVDNANDRFESVYRSEHMGKRYNYIEEMNAKYKQFGENNPRYLSNVALYSGKKPGIITIGFPDRRRIYNTGHTDMSVLLKERKLFDRLPLQYTPGYNVLKDIREGNGEYGYLNAAGKYTLVKGAERFTKKNAKNVLSHGTTPVHYDVRRRDVFAHRVR